MAELTSPKPTVFIVPDETGREIRTNPGSEDRYAYLVVSSAQTSIKSGILGNWARNDKRVALIPGTPDDIAALLKQFKSHGIYHEGKTMIPGVKLQRVEKLKSQLSPDELESLGEYLDNHLKRAGNEKDAPVCMHNGEPIYQFMVVTDDLEATDERIKHDNVGEIKGHAKNVSEIRKRIAEEKAESEKQLKIEQHADAITAEVAKIEVLADLLQYADDNDIELTDAVKAETNLGKLRKAIVASSKEAVTAGKVVL